MMFILNRCLHFGEESVVQSMSGAKSSAQNRRQKTDNQEIETCYLFLLFCAPSFSLSCLLNYNKEITLKKKKIFNCLRL